MMDTRDGTTSSSADHKQIDLSLELASSVGVMTPSHSIDDSPSTRNSRKTRPLSMLSYNFSSSSNHNFNNHNNSLNTPSGNTNHHLTNPIRFSNHSAQGGSSSPLFPETHTRHASFSSAARPSPHPINSLNNSNIITPSKRATRWTVIIIPPKILPHSPPPPHVSGFANGYSASGRYSSGLLLPLQSTLTLQLSSVAREFSLPSTGGLSLHLSLSSADQPSIPGPRVTDESWNILFGWAFDESLPSSNSGLQSFTGLPIAGRFEFDIDLKKARWFEAWAAAAIQSVGRQQSVTVQHPLKLNPCSFGPSRTSDLSIPSSSHGVRTLMISTTTRRGSKSSLDDNTHHSRDTLVRSPVSSKSSQSVSPSKNSQQQQQHDCRVPCSPAARLSNDSVSSESFQQRQLERLDEAELEESPALKQIDWHVQQQNMLRQAALDREQIEIADRLEEERTFEEQRRAQQESHLAEPKKSGAVEGQIDGTRRNSKDESKIESKSRAVEQPQVGEIKKPGVEPTIEDVHRIKEKQKVEEEWKFEKESRIEEGENFEGARMIEEQCGGKQTPRIEEQKKIEEAQTIEEHRKVEEQRGIEARKSLDERKIEEELRNEGVGQIGEERRVTKELKADDEQPAEEKAEPTPAHEQLEESHHADSNLQQSMDEISTTKIDSSSSRECSSEPIEVSALGLTLTPSNPRPVSSAIEVSSNEDSTAKEASRKAHQSLPARPSKTSEGSNSSFSPGLGRSVNRFSGEEELMKRRLQLEHGDEQTQKMIDEMNRYVNEKAMAKEATILSNSFKKNSPEDNSYKPIPVKATIKTSPPPPPTRSKVIQMVKSFGSADQSPATSTASLPNDSQPLSSSSAIPVVPLPPSDVPEPHSEVLAHSPVIQGPSLVQRTRSVEFDNHQSVPINRRPESTSSVSSSPSSRSMSLFKPRLSLGTSLLSSIFRTQPDTPTVVADPLAPLLHCCGTNENLSEELGCYIIRAQDQALERHKKFVIAISGGSLPKLIAPGLLNNPNVKWDAWKIFYADERIVPLDHQDSNFANSMEALFAQVPVDRSQLVSIMGLPPDEIDLDEMAPIVSSIYTAQILEELDCSGVGEDLPRFDLILLGMGDDGHTCSLFPSHKLLDDSTLISWCNDSPKPPLHRITMTLPTLNAAHHIAFVCTGSSKDAMLAAVLEQEPSPTRPASLVKLGHSPVVWFTDEAAAAKTQYPRSICQSVSSDKVEPIQEGSGIDKELSEHGNIRSVELEGLNSYSITSPIESRDMSSVNDDQILASDLLDSHLNSPLVPVAVTSLDSIPHSCRTNEGGLQSDKTRDEITDQGIEDLVEEKKRIKILEAFELGYPNNLRIYPTVYPFIEQQLYPPPPPILQFTIPLSSSSIAESKSVHDLQQFLPSKNDFALREFATTNDLGCEAREAETSTLGGLTSTTSESSGSILTEKSQIRSTTPSEVISSFGEAPESQSPDYLSIHQKEVSKSDLEVQLADSKETFGYPYNLIVYPSIYPVIQVYPETVPHYLTPTNFKEHVNFPAPVTKDTEVIKFDGAIRDKVYGLKDRFGYPYNLIVYPPVYPFIQDQIYPELPSQFAVPTNLVSNSIVPSNWEELPIRTTHQPRSIPAPLTIISTPDYRSQGIAYQSAAQTSNGISDVGGQHQSASKSDGPLSSKLPTSPVAILSSNLPSSFYSGESSIPNQKLPVIPPSIPFASLTTDSAQARSPIVSPAALNAPLSALGPAFFSEAQKGLSIEEKDQADQPTGRKLSLPTSPVAILPSNLAPSFYSGGSCTPSQTPRVIAPSLPLASLTNGNVQARSPVVPAAALDAPPSALGAAFFGKVPHGLSIEEIDQIDQATVGESLTRGQDNDTQMDVDRQSDGAFSQVLKGESSINSHATQHQSTDEEWPPTPCSSGGLPSSDTVPSIKPQLKDSELPSSTTKGQSSSILIEPDNQTSMSTIAQASVISPTIPELHEEFTFENSEGLSSPIKALSDTTPRASMKMDLDSSQVYSVSSKSETKPIESRSSSILNRSDCQSEVAQHECTIDNDLGLKLGESLERSHQDTDISNTPLSSEMLDDLSVVLEANPSPTKVEMKQPEERQPLAPLDVTVCSASQKLIQPSEGSDCLIYPLPAMSNMDAIDPPSPIRLISPPLTDRLVLSPVTSSTVPKQFPTYGTHVNPGEYQIFSSPTKIEVDWNIPQVSLPDASAPSPPRSIALPINPAPSQEFTQRDTPNSVNTDMDPFAPTTELNYSTGVSTYPSINDGCDHVTWSRDRADETTDTLIEFSSVNHQKVIDSVEQSPTATDETNQPESSTPVHAISVDTAVPDPAPQRIIVERPFPVSYGNRNLSKSDSPLLPPINLAMDLSDPLSAASTARSEIDNDTPRGATETPDGSLSDGSLFGESSNEYNEQVRELSAQITLPDNTVELEPGIEVVRHVESGPDGLLPAITKRPPTPRIEENSNRSESEINGDCSSPPTPPPPPPILLPFEDLAEISEALAQFIFEAQEVALQTHGKFQLALGGSILPRILGQGLVGDDRMRWEAWEIFLVEEAIAPLGSPESVLSAINEWILQHVPIPRSQIHSIAELTKTDIVETTAISEGLDSLADSLADEYENKLLELFPESSHETGQPPEFDLILISVGQDGQVGSLYPSHPMLGESNWFVAWLGDAWEPPSHRIMLTLPVLNSAKQFAFVAIGEELAEIVADGLERSIQSDVPMEEDRVNPTALVKSSNLKPVVWFTDLLAASLTDYPKSAFWDEP